MSFQHILVPGIFLPGEKQQRLMAQSFPYQSRQQNILSRINCSWSGVFILKIAACAGGQQLGQRLLQCTGYKACRVTQHECPFSGCRTWDVLMRVEGGAKHWMPFICFPLCRSLHKPGISGCSHTPITPSCILSEWNSRVDVTEWQDPPADRNLVPTPQEPGQAVSDQEVWWGSVSSSNDVDKPPTPSPHPHPTPSPHPTPTPTPHPIPTPYTPPHPTPCRCVCRLVDSLTIVILTLRPPGGDSSSTSLLLQPDWPVWLMYVSQKCLFNQLLKQLINQFHNQIFKQFCCFFFCFVF